MARPGFRPTSQLRKMVEAMSGFGMTEEPIAALIRPGGIDPKTLRKYFRKELTRGQAQAMAKLMQTAYQLAVHEKNVTMIIFLLKTRCGFRETGPVNNGGPHEQLPELTNAEIDRLLRDQFDRIAVTGGTSAVSEPVDPGTKTDASLQVEELERPPGTATAA